MTGSIFRNSFWYYLHKIKLSVITIISRAIFCMRPKARSETGNLLNKPISSIQISASNTLARALKLRYIPNCRRIEIDITYDCNLKCFNCDRSCKQLPSKECMSLTQIEKFIEESMRCKRRWERIRILGGEPTLHPQLFKILELLIMYKKTFSPASRLILVSNGYGSEVNCVLSQIPQEVEIENTRKTTVIQKFFSFNLAPRDFKEYTPANYIQGCYVTQFCGMGLTRYGYYPCGVGGGIDRVLGFNIGRKTLPHCNDPFTEQLGALCPYCGHFKKHNKTVSVEMISLSWEEAYERTRREKPELSLY